VADGRERELHRRRSDAHCPRVRPAPRHPSSGVIVLDLVYAAVIALTFVIVGLIAKGVEKL
jgi:hypothetical protein